MAVFFIDSGLIYSGSATTVITGLDHLEGCIVYGLADGVPVGPFTVSSGSITLLTAVTKAMIGLRYKTTVKTLEPNIGGDNGDSYGQPKEVHGVTAHFIGTGADVKMGIDPDNLQDLPELDETGLKTLDSHVSIDDGYDTAQVTVEQEAALPMYLASISYDVSPGDE